MTIAINWADGPLHAALVEALPTFVRDPFSETPRLDVPKIHKTLNMSNEGVYRWLRSGKLNPKSVRKLVELANERPNVEALKKLGRKPPRVEDFSRFVFA